MTSVINKPKTPIIFLDTSIIIGVVKAKKGELKTDQGDILASLHDTIRALTKKGNLICPKADQREEIDIGARLWEESESLMFKLSHGIEFRHRLEIRDRQIQTAMKDFIEGRALYGIDYHDAFVGDPEKLLSKNLDESILINAYFPPNQHLVDLHKTAKINMQRELEVLRKQCIMEEVSQEEQFSRELRGDLNAILEMNERTTEAFHQDKGLSYSELDAFTEIRMPLVWWSHFNGRPPGIAGLKNFYDSDNYRQVPTVDISCSLYSYALTTQREIVGSDYMDIQFVSAYLPYSDYMVIDKRTKEAVKRLKIDEKYKCLVLCQSDIKDLIKTLDI